MMQISSSSCLKVWGAWDWGQTSGSPLSTETTLKIMNEGREKKRRQKMSRAALGVLQSLVIHVFFHLGDRLPWELSADTSFFCQNCLHTYRLLEEPLNPSCNSLCLWAQSAARSNDNNTGLYSQRGRREVSGQDVRLGEWALCRWWVALGVVCVLQVSLRKVLEEFRDPLSREQNCVHIVLSLDAAVGTSTAPECRLKASVSSLFQRCVLLTKLYTVLSLRSQGYLMSSSGSSCCCIISVCSVTYCSMWVR